MSLRGAGPIAAAGAVVAALATALAIAIALALGGIASPAAAAGLAPTAGPRTVPDTPNRVPLDAGVAPGDAYWQSVFILHCSGCHGADAAGRAGAVPDLRDNLGRLVSSPDGRRFVLQVPGVAQARLADAEVAALTNWMLRRYSPASLPADFPPFQTSEVREARRTRLADVAAERRRVVAALQAQGIAAR